jgi:hypothetical protein
MTSFIRKSGGNQRIEKLGQPPLPTLGGNEPDFGFLFVFEISAQFLIRFLIISTIFRASLTSGRFGKR